MNSSVQENFIHVSYSKILSKFVVFNINHYTKKSSCMDNLGAESRLKT